MATKVLLIGLDAASTPLMEDWMDKGALPHLSALRAQGWYSRLQGEGLSGATWPSIYTGASVARHGSYFYNQLVTGSYRTRVKEEGRLSLPKLWQVLSRSGKKVAVIDAPKTCLDDDLNGIQVINWATHDPDAFNAFDCNSEKLKHRIRQDLPADPLGPNDWGGTGPGDFGRLQDRLVTNVRRRNLLNRQLLGDQDWDLFFTVFDDLHQLGHLAWHHHDKSHPRWRDQDARRYGGSMPAVAIAIDEAIGELLALTDNDTTVLVFNSLGMGPNYTNKLILDRFLDSLAPATATKKASRLYPALSYVWRHVPLFIQKHTLAVQISLRERLFSNSRAKRRFFSLPLNEDSGGIRLNLLGREPKGIIRPEDYERECQKLITALENIHDPDTGRRLVQRAVMTRAVLAGEQIDSLPDIILEWASEHPYQRAVWAEGETTFRMHEYRTGSHRSTGFIAACGPSIAPGEAETPMEIRNIAPAIYHLLGLESSGQRPPWLEQASSRNQGADSGWSD